MISRACGNPDLAGDPNCMISRVAVAGVFHWEIP